MKMVEDTSGCSVEQLEQIYSRLMSEIWRTRGEWNRAHVAQVLEAAFTEVLNDIYDYQGLGQGSMEFEN